MKFLLDENVHHGLIKILTHSGHDVKPSPKGFNNGKVLALSISEKRILITHDNDFSKKITPGRYSGIILVKIPSKYLDRLDQAFSRLFSEEPSAENFSNRLIILND